MSTELQEVVALLIVILVASVALYRRYSPKRRPDTACGGCEGSCGSVPSSPRGHLSSSGRGPGVSGSLTWIKPG